MAGRLEMTLDQHSKTLIIRMPACLRIARMIYRLYAALSTEREG